MGGNHKGEYTAENLISHIEICKAERARLEALGRDNCAIRDLILACRALELMNRLVMCINNVDGYTDRKALQAEFDLWLREYSAAWLCDNKPSDLWRIKEFVSGITE